MADVVVVYQPLPRTLGRVLPMAEATGTPVVVDIDDPHWEGAYGHTLSQRLRVILGMLRRGRSPLPPYRARREALRLPTITASPFVQRRWPGTVIPHVRRPIPTTLLPDGPLRIAFVGSLRVHKGLDALRAAAQTVEGVQLHITAPPPGDARANETWLGTTSLEAGRDLLLSCHLTAVLQEDSRWTRQQFPVKVVDGMMAGRVVLGTDVPPIRWATGGNAVLVPPSDPAALVAALTRARDDRVWLARIAAAARTEAEARFTPNAIAPIFRDAIVKALDASD